MGSTSEYVEQSKTLFGYVSNQIKVFLEGIVQECEKKLGTAPCEYSVIGLSSMALAQITPYSDLEFAILVENRDFKYDPPDTVREYFKNLKDKEYDLVQTIQGMMEYVENKNNRTDNKDKTLSNILLETTHIYGNRRLSEEYQDKVRSFLEQSTRKTSSSMKGER